MGNTSGMVGVLLREVFGNDGALSGGDPVLIQQETAVGGNSDARGGVVRSGSCSISTPDLFDYYTDDWGDGRTRVGGRQLAPPTKLPTSFPCSGNFTQLLLGRRRRPEGPWV